MSGSEEPDADPDSEGDSDSSDSAHTAEPSSGSGAPSNESGTPPDEPTDGLSDADAREPGASETSEEDSGGFLGNLKNAKGQLGDAKEAFSNARGAGNLPTDEEGRVRIVCRRYEERRLAPLDDKGRPTCYEAGNEDCESCVDAVNDGEVGTW